MEGQALVTVLSLVLAAVSVAVTVYFGRYSARQVVERMSVRRFLRVRQVLSRSGLGISRVAAASSRDLIPPEAPYVLAGQGWILERPRRLEDLELRFVDLADADCCLERLRTLRRYLPVDAMGRRFDRYHEAVTAFDRPSLWFDAKTYRLLGVDPADSTAGPALSLRVGASRYWNCFDFDEGLRHEAAHHYLASGGRKISDFGASFYLHRRGDQVAVGQNETSLVPAGEFQPSDDSRFALHRDLDIWLAMMREYAEELLNIDEVRQGRGAPIDYAAESPFRELQAARTAGLVRPYLLGIGLDPASWKAVILTVCIFDALAFDDIFGNMVAVNREGVLEIPTLHRAAGAPLTGWDFTEKTVEDYLQDPSLSSHAKVVLGLAWRHRATILQQDD
ncbi:MAG: hypothetical protein LC776_08450 [Acidobacteria bacterium]|nr:hypothetical protein [Acidobacteriota bacterium]